MRELLLRLLGIDTFDSSAVDGWPTITFANMKTNFQLLIFILLAGALGYGIWWCYKREPDYCPRPARSASWRSSAFLP